MDRTPYDGKPYYCETCGLGFGEFMACEEVNCALESDVTARARRAFKMADARKASEAAYVGGYGGNQSD